MTFHAGCAAPAGTENGSLCAFCGIVRPPADDDAFVQLLTWTEANLGIADAQLVAHSLDAKAAKAIAENNEWYFFQPRDDLTVLVQAARQSDEYRGGAVAASILLKDICANRPVRRALRTGHPRVISLQVQHWTSSARAHALLTHGDVRRMARIGAALSYELVPDLKPQVSDQGECVHCNYVAFQQAEQRPGSAND